MCYSNLGVWLFSVEIFSETKKSILKNFKIAVDKKILVMYNTI